MPEKSNKNKRIKYKSPAGLLHRQTMMTDTFPKNGSMSQISDGVFFINHLNFRLFKPQTYSTVDKQMLKSRATICKANDWGCLV